MLLALLALVVSVSMWGATITGSRDKEVKITYQSVDANNNPITLSAMLYYQRRFASTSLESTIDMVVLNCHPTISHNNGCPTGSDPQLGAIKYMVSENALVVCPDYIGFGASSSKNHPYMCATLTARNVLDCYKAAINNALNVQKVNFSSQYYTINIGYSQGGATALAFQKYLETEASQADRDLVKLRGSLCGAGPYDQGLVFDIYEDKAEMSYPAYLPYALMGLKETFGETIMRGIALEDCFTEKFNNTNFMQTLLAKNTTIDDLNTAMINAGFKSFYDILSPQFRDKTSALYRSVRKALDQSNLLDGRWKPEAPIAFYHYGNDEVVPSEETEQAYALFNGMGCNVRKLSQDDYDISDNRAWDLAFSLGGYSRDYNHRNCGVYFYLMFLSGNLRPEGSVVSRTPSAVSIPTPTSLAVAANATSADGSYDRITTAMPYAIPAGKPVFLQFAAPVDGYYFGADAPRYEVTLNADGEAVSYEEMADDADFEAGKVYLVTSEREETAPVVSMTAGVKTATVASDLAWRELNIRKLNVLGGTSYASAYMPFAYTGDLAYTVSGELNGNKEVTLTATQQKSVPVGTGVLLIDDDAATSVVLSPATESLTNAEISDNILSGTYTAMDNDYEKYLLFGKCTHTPAHVGFFPSYSALAIKPFSAFIDRGTHAAKGYELSWGEDAILRVVAQGKSQVIYGMDGAKRSTMQQGVNIIRMEDGSVRKVINK